MEWLYRGPGSSVNREEYLLGKKIDKMVDPTLVEEEREREVRKFCGKVLNGKQLVYVLLCLAHLLWSSPPPPQAPSWVLM